VFLSEPTAQQQQQAAVCLECSVAEWRTEHEEETNLDHSRSGSNSDHGWRVSGNPIGYGAARQFCAAVGKRANRQGHTHNAGKFSGIKWSVSPDAKAQLSFRTTGTVEQVNVVPGDQVKQGDVLATLDSSDLQLKVAQAEQAYLMQQLNYSTTVQAESVGCGSGAGVI